MKASKLSLIACVGIHGAVATSSSAAGTAPSVTSSSPTMTTTELSRDCSGIPGVTDESCGEGYYCYIGYYLTTPIYDCALISTPPPATAVSEYGQCGGIGYAGLTNCASGLTCVRDNDYFSQCFSVAASTTSTFVSSSAPSTPTPTSTTQTTKASTTHSTASTPKTSAPGKSTSSASAKASTHKPGRPSRSHVTSHFVTVVVTTKA